MSLEYFVKKLLSKSTRKQWDSWLREASMDLAQSLKGTTRDKIISYIANTDLRHTEKPLEPLEDPSDEVEEH